MGRKYREYENRMLFFSLSLLEKRFLVKSMIINSLNKLILCQKWVVQCLDAGDTIMWKKDMIPTLITAHSAITKRKTKKQYSVVSTKMEICTPCFGKTWCAYLHRQKQIKLCRKKYKLGHKEWGSLARLRVEGKNISNARG